MSKQLPFFYVGKAVTEERKKNFMDKKYQGLCDKLGKLDTQSIWYSREHIEGLLQEIDHVNGDGLRLHFGSYEEGHEFAGQLCLVMNTTREKKSGVKIEHLDVITENEPDFKERSRAERSTTGNQVQRERDYNFGSPCPPRCPGEGGE